MNYELIYMHLCYLNIFIKYNLIEKKIIFLNIFIFMLLKGAC